MLRYSVCFVFSHTIPAQGLTDRVESTKAWALILLPKTKGRGEEGFWLAACRGRTAPPRVVIFAMPAAGRGGTRRAQRPTSGSNVIHPRGWSPQWSHGGAYCM